jgi:D-alanyl-D-alanine dipeptidase
MNKAGFVRHKREWWHFNLPNLKDFPLIEESIKDKLPKMSF